MAVVDTPRAGRRQQAGSPPHHGKMLTKDGQEVLPSTLSTGPQVSERQLPLTQSVGGASNHRQPQPGLWINASRGQALASEVVYCVVSAGTTLFNKHALSTYDFPAPNSLLLFQFVLAMVLLEVLHLTRVITLQPMRWELVKLWLPVNLIFVAMNATGFYALQDIGAGMFTVLKNLSNLMTIAGDYLFFGYTYNWQVWGCLGLMIMSALLGGVTDMQFSLRGYSWQLVNCLFTAAYSLYLSGVIRKLMRGRHQLSEVSMVYYNNLLSVPPMLLLSVISGEWPVVRKARQLGDTNFQVVAIVGGLLGFGVSFASIWCMSRTSATIYSLTGSMNKVVVAVAGIWMFHERTNLVNMLSIGAGLAAGALFVCAKSSGPSNSSSGGAGPGSSGGGLQQHKEQRKDSKDSGMDEDTAHHSLLVTSDSMRVNGEHRRQTVGS